MKYTEISFGRLTALRLFTLAAGLAFMVPARGEPVAETEPVDLGSRRELFVDDLLIGELDGTTLEMHRPQPGGVAIRYDGPVDGIFSFYTTVLKDGDVYRMYYRGYEPKARFGGDLKKNLTCYAESDDGIHWTKPNLGIIELDGSGDNNAILPSGMSFCPFIDDRPGVPPSERYKANMEGRVEGKAGLIGYVSADAIHWSLVSEEPIVRPTLRNHFDSQNAMFWSEIEQSYVLYARYAAGASTQSVNSIGGGLRSFARSTSDDFLHWSDPVPVTYSDTGSTMPSQHLYTNQTQPYFRAPHIYISMPGRLQQGRRVLTDEQGASVDVHAGGGGLKDVADGVLLTSRAGTALFDFSFRESFVRPGIGYNNWTSRNNYPALGIVPTGPGEISIYVQRNYGQRSAWLERMTLRLDGFVSVNAPYDGGQFLTRPLTFSGTTLEINYSTSAAGSIRVEILDTGGSPIEGYGLTDCPEIIGDEISRVVRWEGGSDLSGLIGKPVRLRFHMVDADLYSLRFSPEG